MRNADNNLSKQRPGTVEMVENLENKKKGVKYTRKENSQS